VRGIVIKSRCLYLPSSEKRGSQAEKKKSEDKEDYRGAVGAKEGGGLREAHRALSELLEERK